MPNGEFREFSMPIPTWRRVLEAEQKHLGHAKHLCNLVDQGIPLAEYKEYVKNPEYICNKCGRVAAKAENLCEPCKL